MKQQGSERKATTTTYSYYTQPKVK